RHRRLRSGAVGPCRPQHRQHVPRLWPRLDRRLVGAGAGCWRSDEILPAAQPACRGVCAGGRSLVADARGALKRKEMISARFGDILSELYLSSAALKRWNDEGRQQDDYPLLAYCLEASLATIEMRFDELLANFPIRPVAWLLRLLIQPL